MQRYKAIAFIVDVSNFDTSFHINAMESDLMAIVAKHGKPRHIQPISVRIEHRNEDLAFLDDQTRLQLDDIRANNLSKNDATATSAKTFVDAVKDILALDLRDDPDDPNSPPIPEADKLRQALDRFERGEE